VTVSVPVLAPATTGSYSLKYDVIQEGVTCFSWQGVSMLEVPVSVVN